MKIIEIRPLAIPDIKVIRFERFGDARGYFTEPFGRLNFSANENLIFLKGVELSFCKESFSRPSVIRGLHFQWNPPMGKLVRTLYGRMVDLVLDIRKDSPTFGKVIAYDMRADSSRGYAEWIWVPPGFAHGSFFTEPTCTEYFCSSEYNPACEAGISPLAGDLDWSLCPPELKREFDDVARSGIMSQKDRTGLSLGQWKKNPRGEEFEKLTGGSR